MSRNLGQVRIVGGGLLGTSIGLALTKLGHDVVISDTSPATQALAVDYGAGRVPAVGDNPSLVVVCVPPDVTPAVVLAELTAYPNAVVTDVASVKLPVLQQLQESASATGTEALLTNYVGSHPMAGRERGGAISGRADLFNGRPWVIVPHHSEGGVAATSAEAVNLVTDLALSLGAQPVTMEATEHDHAVAAVSHVPQLISSLLAARLISTSAQEIALAGQGLRDTTRIAASDPSLWVQILSANAEQVAPVLKDFAADLASVIAALDNVGAPGSLSSVSKAIEQGNRGVSRIPGKHGSSQTEYAVVVAMIDDKPGEWARLLTDVGHIGINLEDMRMEHSPGAQIGLVELSVLPQVEAKLIEELNARGWRLA